MCFPHAGQQLCDLCNVVLVLTFVLTTFGHICPCQILAGAELIYGCVHLLWSHHRRTMSNKPFHGLIWLRILYAHASLIFQHTLLFFLFLFRNLISTSFLPDIPSLLLLQSAHIHIWCPFFYASCLLLLFLLGNHSFVVLNSGHTLSSYRVVGRKFRDIWWEMVDNEPLHSKMPIIYFCAHPTSMLFDWRPISADVGVWLLSTDLTGLYQSTWLCLLSLLWRSDINGLWFCLLEE